ncbi:MAG: FAD-dependent oxidoreductase, partial [Desulfatiglandales bacterium]|nr:FAD-dependent oxidoreductase [Desulfatiglandales bacterium]
MPNARSSTAAADNILPPCQFACPIKQDVRSYIALLSQGKIDHARDVVLETNPLPLICGTVCAHPCEDKCRRGDVDEALSIRALKRFILENASIIPTCTGHDIHKYERVAVIGSGPAGLTAANDLARMGYGVTVFECENNIGGIVRTAIPEFRLSSTTIESDVEKIKELGVEFKTGVKLGRDFSLDDLLIKDTYRAVLLSMGLHKSSEINIPGADMTGVIHALEFLKAARKGE